MKTITLFDICREHMIPTVQYSANPETLQRWKDESNSGLRMVALDCGYAYMEPDILPEYCIDFVNGELTYKTQKSEIDWQIYQLASILYNQYGLDQFRLYYYQTDDDILISGIY